MGSCSIEHSVSVCKRVSVCGVCERVWSVGGVCSVVFVRLCVCACVAMYNARVRKSHSQGTCTPNAQHAKHTRDTTYSAHDNTQQTLTTRSNTHTHTHTHTQKHTTTQTYHHRLSVNAVTCLFVMVDPHLRVAMRSRKVCCCCRFCCCRCCCCRCCCCCCCYCCFKNKIILL